MTSDRQRALIERLLSEAEDAVVAGQWDVVARHAQSVLALDSSNPDGLALKAAAERLSADAPKQESLRAEGQGPADGRALFNRGISHGAQGDTDATIADYTSVIEDYSDDTDPEMRELVAKALVNRGVSHGVQGDHDAAIADYTSVIEAYSDDTDPEIRELVASALVNRGEPHKP